MQSHPEVLELDEADLLSKLDRIEAALGPEMAQPFRQLLRWYAVLLDLLREKKIRLQRLRKILFGASTERTSQVVPSSAERTGPGPEATTANPDSGQGASSSDGCLETSGKTPDDRPTARRRPPGHGRIPACQYTGCVQVVITHPTLHPGDGCPQCATGTVYRQSLWSLVVRLKGQTPVTGQLYQRERLRCHTCGKVFTPELPPEAGHDKYDPTVPAIVATLRYGEGLPWNRLQQLQQFAGVPLPASVQWELVRDAADRGPRDAYQQLLSLAAQGELFHNDDTTMRVLALTAKTKAQQPLREEAPERRGVFTTSVLSRTQDRPTIALFFTGPHHAGENLRTVLEHRVAGLPPPIQMCDALSRNLLDELPDGLRVIVAHCLVHGRRNFVDVVEAFPTEVQYVLECLKKVYKTDAQARQQQLAPDARLRLHQAHSSPVMDELHRWLQTRLDEKSVEPNSSLGGAIAYMLKHWERLTLFLRVSGAPLDNNICERALKMAIRHRKNSLFYKTLRGAAVGDLYMSLIHTCYLSGASPFDYLTELQRHAPRVRDHPADWMPWNYRRQLFREATAPAADGSAPAEDAVGSAHVPRP